MRVIWFLFRLPRLLFVGRAVLIAENLALRQQLAILQRENPQPRLRWRDRLFWVWLSRWFFGWQSWLILVKPETVIGWHRRSFRWFWRWKSGRGTPGRSAIPRQVIALIKRMAREKATWGAAHLGRSASAGVRCRRVHRGQVHAQGQETAVAELEDVSQESRWLPVLDGLVRGAECHLRVPVRLRHLAARAPPSHPLQRDVAANGSMGGSAIAPGVPLDTAPRYLIRDRDGIYGKEVRHALQSMVIEEVLTAPCSAWQNTYCERLTGTIRRDCLDHAIVQNECHLMRLLRSCFNYCHTARCHQALEGNAPNPRAIEPKTQGKVVAIPMVGGSHHRYRRSG